jgi:hypothetical protein
MGPDDGLATGGEPPPGPPNVPWLRGAWFQKPVSFAGTGRVPGGDRTSESIWHSVPNFGPDWQ